MQAVLLRDKCRKQKKFVEYKQQRNRVNYLVREAKKKYFNDLAGDKADISSMWRVINILTKGHSSANNNLPSELTPDVFNAHFVSVVSKFSPDDQTDGSHLVTKLAVIESLKITHFQFLLYLYSK